MATHLAGVSDIIPGLLPWQPDLDFYRTALQYKEQQFEQGYQKVNSIYNSIFNSPLSREDNTARRDDIFKKIDLDLKKSAKTDLSKRENIEAASKIFTPILKDKYLIKDIAFTKTYFDEMNKAEALRNCVGKNCPEHYWQEGVEELNYRVEDFQKDTLENTLSHANPRYTNYQNIYKQAIEYAKEMGFNMDVEPFLTPDGRYRVKMTNGIYAVPYFQNFLLNAFSSKPEFQDVANTQAYVQRKRFAKGYAEQYGGEENAEMQYMRNILTSVSERFKKEQEELNKAEKAAIGQTKVLEELNQRPKNQRFPEDLSQNVEEAKQGVEIIKQSKNFAEETLKLLDNTSIEPSNLNVIRQRVDGAVSNAYLYDQLDQAAFDYSTLTQKIDIEADPYALANYNHSLRIREIREEARLDEEAEIRQQELLESPPPLFSPDGVQVDGNAGQFADVNINSMIADDFNIASGQAAGIGAELSEEVFNILNNQLKTEKDPAKRAYIEQKINDIFKITEEQPIVRKKTGRETTELMARSWYQYINSLPKEKRNKYLEDNLTGVAEYMDGDEESFVRAVLNVSDQTGGLWLNDPLKSRVNDMQDMAYNIAHKDSDWDGYAITRSLYGSGWGLDKDFFQGVIKTYKTMMAKDSIETGKGWVVKDNKGNLKFNKTAMRAADSLNIQDDPENPLNPISVTNRIYDYMDSPEAQAFFPDQSTYIDFVARKLKPKYSAFKASIDARETFAAAQRNNNIEVVDALTIGVGGMGTPELWKRYGEHFITSSGDVLSKEQFIQKTQNILRQNDPALITYRELGVDPGKYNPNYAKISENIYEQLSEEFYESFDKGLPGVSAQNLRLPYEAEGGGRVFTDGRMYGYDGRYLNAEGDNSTKNFSNFVLSGDLNRAIENSATRFYSGDIKSTFAENEMTSDDQEMLRGALSQIFNDVAFDRSANLKTPAEQRPKFNYSLYDISEGNVDRRAMTITFDQNFAKKLSETSKTGEESAYARVFGGGNFSVTMTFPKPIGEELYAPINTPDYTKLLNLKGGESVKVYDDPASGTIEARKLPTGSYQIESYMNQIFLDQQGRLNFQRDATPTTITVPKGYDISRTIDEIRERLMMQSLENQMLLLQTELPNTDGTQ